MCNFVRCKQQIMYPSLEIMTPFQTIQQTLAPDLKRLNDRIVKAHESTNDLINNVINH